jgi:arginine/lysine/ornithine decarboxylase
VVSVRRVDYAEKLAEGLDIFRTTSPSYPIMASVEYAVKYPRNEGLETAVKDYANGNARVYLGEDWTKLFALFQGNAFAVEKELQALGIYAEFCDGDGILFYLSPATDEREWALLKEALDGLFARYPLQEKTGEKGLHYDPSPLACCVDGEKEWVELSQAEGRISAAVCGLFPPCTPLLRVGEVISSEKLALLAKAGNVFGLKERKISVYRR